MSELNKDYWRILFPIPHFIVSSRPAVMIVKKNKCLHDSWVLFNSSVFMFCYVFTGQNGAITLMNSHSNISNLTRSLLFLIPWKKNIKTLFSESYHWLYKNTSYNCTKIVASFMQVCLFSQSNSNNSQRKSHLMQLIHTILAPLCNSLWEQIY